jgi:hypothetical protein
MTANPHLAPILDGYLDEKSPGYAVMVTAPWGAGKTFAVDGWLKGKDHVKVSLFGLTSLQEIDEALFDALVSKRDFKTPKGVAKALEGITKKLTGAEVDLTGFHRRQILSALPKLLVFDDLERAQMPAPQLLAALNRFVEHEGRWVVLIANEAELNSAPEAETISKKSDYRRWREKVVGRTVTLQPETEIALPHFVEAIPETKGRKLLADHEALIERVFNHSGTQNLRLLRQSCAELARFLPRLPQHYLSQSRILPGLVADFVALYLARHQGKLADEDFDFHGRSWKRAAKRANGEESVPDQIGLLLRAFENVPEVSLNGMSLPGELARQLVVLGHADKAAIEHLMKQAASFEQSVPEPWRILWYWPQVHEDEVVQALRFVKDDLAAFRIEEPEVILHVFGTFLDLEKHKLFDFTEGGIVKAARDYINKMTSSGKLRFPEEENDWEVRSLREASRGYGYHQRETKAFQSISAAMLDALEKLRSSSRPKIIEDLLQDLQTDPRRFGTALRGGDKRRNISDLSDDLLFIDADPAIVAEQVFALPPDRWTAFLSPFKERVRRQEQLASHYKDGRPTERQWLEGFRRSAHNLASAASPLKQRQMQWALSALAFLDPAQPAKN